MLYVRVGVLTLRIRTITVSGKKDTKTLISDDELAVAISYKPNQEQAPHLVAKGQGWVARQIVEVAQANGITVREDADLAQILSKVDVDSEIPMEAFTVVAEILSYIYAKNKTWPEGLDPSEGKS